MNYRNIFAGLFIAAMMLAGAPASEARSRRGFDSNAFGAFGNNFGAYGDSYGGYGNGYGGAGPYQQNAFVNSPYGSPYGAQAYNPYGYQDYRRRQRRNRTRNIVLGVAAVAILSQVLK